MSQATLAVSAKQDFSIGKGVAFAVLAAAGFSAKAIFVKLAYRYQVDAVTLLNLRMLFALPFFAFIAWSPSGLAIARRFDRKTWGSLLTLGLMGYYLSSIFDFIGLQYISSALERLVLFLYPTFVLLMSALFFGKKITGRALVALMLCYGGIGLAVSHDLQHALDGDTVLIGVAWVLACAVCYAFYLVGAGELVKKIGALHLAAWACLFSTLGVAVHFLLTREPAALVQPLPVYGYGLAMGLISTVLPVTLTNEAMRLLGASRVAMVSTIGPMLTLLMGWVILGEAMSTLQMIGAALVIGGVVVVNRSR